MAARASAAAPTPAGSVRSRPTGSADTWGPREAAIVLDVAARLFYAGGVHEVGMDELVRETGLGKATVPASAAARSTTPASSTPTRTTRPAAPPATTGPRCTTVSTDSPNDSSRQTRPPPRRWPASWRSSSTVPTPTPCTSGRAARPRPVSRWRTSSSTGPPDEPRRRWRLTGPRRAGPMALRPRRRPRHGGRREHRSVRGPMPYDADGGVPWTPQWTVSGPTPRRPPARSAYGRCTGRARRRWWHCATSTSTSPATGSPRSWDRRGRASRR
ncbi:TetR family transcriptional regulator [Virgisporangium ochraceum]|uniref:TetR family transcriptional regulator n=1 Tax=Virgisporangium ochraceum TaxID=65505 RepID=UPI0035A225EE